MNFAIIAAGKGSRLAEEGCEQLKPMVKLGENTLIERLITIFNSCDAEKIAILFNEDSLTIQAYAHTLEEQYPNVYIHFKSTESSLHSFCELMDQHPEMHEVCLTTTDTVFLPHEFSQYIRHFQQSKDTDALMAVTDFVDDESPLYVRFDQNMTVTSFDDDNENKHPFVSGGIYCLRQKAINVAGATLAKGIHRMRNYQRALLENHLNVKAYPFSQIVDIDHVGDIAKAKQFIQKN